MANHDPFCSEALPLLPELRSAARRFAGARADVADDLVQEMWLRALAASDRYQPGTNARAWLYAILFNAARSSYRRERRDRRLQERYAREPAATGDGTNEAAHAPQPASAPLSRPVRAMLAALPEPFREVVEQVDIEGKSYRDVADGLGVPVGTVMSRLHRGRRRLRAAMEAHAPTHEALERRAA